MYSQIFTGVQLVQESIDSMVEKDWESMNKPVEQWLACFGSFMAKKTLTCAAQASEGLRASGDVSPVQQLEAGLF